MARFIPCSETNMKKQRKTISRLAYESLCRKACATPKHPAPNETVEDVYWWSICHAVHRYLNVPFSYQDIENASRGHVYRSQLLQLVGSRQTELFDILAIANKHILQAIKQTCDVHGALMKPQTVPLIYGLPVRDEELIEARSKLFPNARSYFIGGCVVGSGGYETETFVCEQCRTAERAWRLTPA